MCLNLSINHGVIQGDIHPTILFLVDLDKLLKDRRTGGIQITLSLQISSIEYADDAVLLDKDTRMANKPGCKSTTRSRYENVNRQNKSSTHKIKFHSLKYHRKRHH